MSQKVIPSVFRIAFAFFLFLSASERCFAAPPADKPNVIVIMADDFGFECIGANGGKSYKTPVLDQLAASGMRFNQCYVQPLCTPTRIQLMTGKYNIRNYSTFGEMNPESYTFGNLFKDAGYATCIAGKWQLGRNAGLPKKFGFDESCLWQHTRRPERYRNPGLEINGVEKNWTNGEYGPDLVNEYAIDFITRKKDQPFFLYYPMMLTHSPYTPTPDSEDYGESTQGKAKKNKKQRKKQPSDAETSNVVPSNAPTSDNIQYRHFADMVAYTDKLVGKLAAKLDELKLRDNTLLNFLGDNGTGKGTPSILNDREFIGGKGMMTHRGMHVPLIVSWPAKMNGPGRVSHDLVDSTDIFATIAEAAGISLPAKTTIDGKSFCPQLRGEPGTPRDWYYSWYAPHAVLVGEFAADHRYKLYRHGKFYDLRKDLDEQRPLSLDGLNGEAAAAAKKLQSALDQFQDARPPELAKRKKAVGREQGQGRSGDKVSIAGTEMRLFRPTVHAYRCSARSPDPAAFGVRGLDPALELADRTKAVSSHRHSKETQCPSLPELQFLARSGDRPPAVGALSTVYRCANVLANVATFNETSHAKNKLTEFWL